MSSTRLNKELRFLIRSSLMQRAFVERKQQIEYLEHELGMEIYNDMYSPQIREDMSKLPRNFFEESICIKVVFNNCFHTLFVKEPLIFGYLHNSLYTPDIYSIPGDHNLSEKFFNIKKLKDDFAKEQSRLEKQLSVFHNKCATVQKLIETWPDVEPILKELNIQTSQSKEVQLPAVIHGMNELFRLNGAEVQDTQTQDAA